MLSRSTAPVGGPPSAVPQGVLAVVCGGYAVGAACAWRSRQGAMFMGDFGLRFAALVAAVSCGLYARRHRSRFRPAWMLFAASSGMAGIGNGVWGWYEVIEQTAVPSPSLADFCFL